MIRSAAAVTLFVSLVIVAFVARVPAQQTQAPIQTELLSEVRLLRQAIESLAGTNARVQIVFGRLQLQEQRMQAAAARLEIARMPLSSMNQRATEAADRYKDLEEAIAENRFKPEQIEAMRGELRALRREIDQVEAERVRLQTAEADAASALTLEQGRWSDLNRQLEDLERTLIKQ
jgi:predicted  nucleic acid-binding Zn-ribbon protein